MTSDDRIVDASIIGTGVFVVSATLGVIGSDSLHVVSAVVAGLLFVVGCGAFLAGFLAGVGRSRAEEIDLPGLVFLTGTAPPPIQRVLRSLLFAQIVIALTSAAIRPFTESAFGVLVPMFGLGLMTLWGGRHGDFVTKESSQRADD